MTRDVLIKRWIEIGDKISDLAGEFPAELYGFRPAKGVRSFAEQLRHVAFWNHYLEKTLRGEAADGDANELPSDRYPTKTKIAAVVRASTDAVTAQLTKDRASLTEAQLDQVVGFIEHNGEHYGQLVISYRLNGLVPPASRSEVAAAGA